MSWVKSLIRIIGLFCLLIDIDLAAIILIVAEVVGIAEEKYEV